MTGFRLTGDLLTGLGAPTWPDQSDHRIRVRSSWRTSTEHQISCVSAGGVLRALDPAVFDVIPVGITPKGSWVLVTGETDRLALSAARCLRWTTRRVARSSSGPLIRRDSSASKRPGRS